MPTTTVKVSVRLDAVVHAILEVLARDDAISSEALIQRILTLHVTKCARKDGLVDPADIDRLEQEQRVIASVVRRACELDEQGAFDEQFTLTVIRDLMADPDFRADYETAIAGDAYQNGLPGKFPLNMNLGRFIKNAVPGAVPFLDSNGKPRRMQVRNEPIQSFTLLTKS